MPYPNLSLVKGFEQRVLGSYAAHLYLRAQLTMIHRSLHGQNGSCVLSLVGHGDDSAEVEDTVSKTRWVASSFAFAKDDPPAPDILGARLRSQYWATQIITYQPFIKTLLEFNYSAAR